MPHNPNAILSHRWNYSYSLSVDLLISLFDFYLGLRSASLALVSFLGRPTQDRNVPLRTIRLLSVSLSFKPAGHQIAAYISDAAIAFMPSMWLGTKIQRHGPTFQPQWKCWSTLLCVHPVQTQPNVPDVRNGSAKRLDHLGRWSGGSSTQPQL